MVRQIEGYMIKIHIWARLRYWALMLRICHKFWEARLCGRKHKPSPDWDVLLCVHRVLLRCKTRRCPEFDRKIAILCTLRVNILLSRWALAAPIGSLSPPGGPTVREPQICSCLEEQDSLNDRSDQPSLQRNGSIDLDDDWFIMINDLQRAQMKYY
jgi:hypothetical protein